MGLIFERMWYAFQGLIMFAVLASQLGWHRSRNVCVAAFAAYIVAGYATVAVKPDCRGDNRLTIF